MKTNKRIFDTVQTGKFIGSNRASGRVTVIPDWVMRQTDQVYGSNIRGPYRYFKSNSIENLEIEVPNIKSISWNRSISNSVGSCTIEIYNQWMDRNEEQPELVDQLGKPGWFWPTRGGTQSLQEFGQFPAEGAFQKDGIFDPNFQWKNCLVPHAMIITYEGYGGHDLSIEEALDQGFIEQTGVWLIDQITAGTSGMLTLSCSDVGRLLQDQISYPPVVPPSVYPLDYYPPGKSNFDSSWGPSAFFGVSPASYGEVKMTYKYSSLDFLTSQANASVYGHRGSDLLDGNVSTFALSPAYPTPNGDANYTTWEFEFLEKNRSVDTWGNITEFWGETDETEIIDAIRLKPWAGGFTIYVSVYGVPVPERWASDPTQGHWPIQNPMRWLGSETIPGTSPGFSSVPYLKKTKVGYRLPDERETEIRIDFDQQIEARYIRITIAPEYYYSGMPDVSGNQYRCGVRTVVALRRGELVGQVQTGNANTPWTYGMDAHPTRGYWVADDDGNVYGFGDAANYDSTGFGPIPLQELTPWVQATEYGRVYEVPVYGGYPLSNYGAGWFDEYWSRQAQWITDNSGALWDTWNINAVPYSTRVFRIQWTVPEYIWDARLDYAADNYADVYVRVSHTLSGAPVPWYKQSWKRLPSSTDWHVFTSTGWPWGGLWPDEVYELKVVLTNYWDDNDLGGNPSGFIFNGLDNGRSRSFLISGSHWQVQTYGNHVVDMAAHPSGQGYWVLDRHGTVHAQGRAWNYGSVTLPYLNTIYPGFSVPSYNTRSMGLTGRQAMGIASTHTGNGYWVIYSNGVVHSFGDALTIATEGGFDIPLTMQFPITAQTTRMINSGVPFVHYEPADNSVGYIKTEVPSAAYNWARRGTAICGHPTEYGFWAVDGSGQVWAHGAAQHYGELNNRTYTNDLGTKFTVDYYDFPHAIECTKDGKGYWIVFQSGKIAAFGNALEKDVFEIFQGNPAISPGTDMQGEITPGDKIWDWEWTRSRVWSMARDPDGSGFWLLRGDGNVVSYKSDYWGKPGWEGLTGMRFHEGNYGDYSDIVKDFLAWGGFTAHQEIQTSIKLEPGLILANDSYLTIGGWYFIMQDDNNLVLYDDNPYNAVGEEWKDMIIWSSGTNGQGTPGATCHLSEEGELYVLNPDGSKLWTSTSWSPAVPNSLFMLTDDGFCGLVSKDSGLEHWWCSSGQSVTEERPPVWGAIESTGITNNSKINTQTWDMKTLLECIEQVKEIVGYIFYIDSDGDPQFHTPSWWTNGNRTLTREKIFSRSTEDGWEFCDEEDEGAEIFIPVIHESVNLMDYQAALRGIAMRSEIIVGSSNPDFSGLYDANFTSYWPESVSAEIRPGVPLGRNVHRIMGFVEDMLTDKNEQLLMAELINLHIWFSQRTGSVTIPGNPNLSPDDQVQIVERNTSEYAIHYIREVSSNLDLDSGQYQMTLTTNWLGTGDGYWVITTDEEYDPLEQIWVSERVVRWLESIQESGLALPAADPVAQLSGGFV